MGKMKIRKSAAKRFKITKNGKVLFGHQYAGHLKAHKSKSRLRRQKEPGELTGVFARNVKRMLGE
jgi:large subunit ribosomal protein L35